MSSAPPGSIDLLLVVTAVSAAIAFSLLLAVVIFVLCYERSKIFTPFNVALLVMALANFSTFLSTALIYSAAYSTLVSEVLSLIGQSSSSSYQTAFVHYSWKRGNAVVEMFTPSSTKFLRVLYYISPFIFFLPAIPNIITIVRRDDPQTWASISMALNSFSTLITCVFDVILMRAFIKLLRSPESGHDTNSVHSAMESGSNNVTSKFETKVHLRKPSRAKLISKAPSRRRFLIIAKYGIASIVCAFLVIIFYLTSAYTTSIAGYVTLVVLVDMFMNVYFGLLFWMKVELFWEKVQSVREKESQLEENLGKVQLERIRNRQTSQAS
ncbi:hypothetical protein HDU83_007273 [Entophlyctis luteolus]|nr:hypothetical protein HDU83_007273 [Entophlyctis luteolus]